MLGVLEEHKTILHYGPNQIVIENDRPISTVKCTFHENAVLQKYNVPVCCASVTLPYLMSFDILFFR